MTLWLLVPLFALAQASCYDYEYYDPTTGSSLPGNACAKAGVATTGQPVTVGTPISASTTFSGSLATAPVVGSSSISAPVYGTPVYSAPLSSTGTVYGSAALSAAPLSAAPVYSAPISTGIYGTASAPLAATPVYGTVASSPIVTRSVATPVYGTVSAPAAVTVSAPVVSARVTAAPRVATSSNGQSELSQQQIAYYKRIGEQQQRDHKINQRIVKQANNQLARSSLVNRIAVGSGNVASWYPMYRLGQQKRVSDAFKDEVRIANRNADDAYDRFKQNPTRLNMLVSKYQDLNADLREAASHYNDVNAGTFGQRLTSTGLFGGSSLTNIISQTLVTRQESEDLQDIQFDMNRIAQQIQMEVRRLQQTSSSSSSASAASASANQQQGAGSVQQRMMAMSVYGPRQG